MSGASDRERGDHLMSAGTVTFWKEVGITMIGAGAIMIAGAVPLLIAYGDRQNHLDAEIATHSTELATQAAEIRALVDARASDMGNRAEQWSELDARVARIENKVDLLLEKAPR